MELFWIAVLVIVGILGIAFSTSAQGARDETKQAIPDYAATQSYEPKVWDKSQTGISIDEARHKICLSDHTKSNPYRVVNYHDILESEIVEDGYSVTKTARGSQLAGGVIGTVALGGLGMVVGALSGKTITKEKATSIDLRIVIKDTANPIHIVRFLSMETQKGGLVHRNSMNEAKRWHAILSIVVTQA